MIKSLYILWKSFFQICLFERGPQDLPASYFLLAVSLSVYISLSLGLNLPGLSFFQAITAAFIEASVLSGLTISLLWMAHYPARIVQTLTAITGASVVINLLGLPFIIWILVAGRTPEMVEIPTLFLFLLALWNFGVTAHIFRHALSSSFGIGLVVSFVFMMVLLVIIYSLFPPTLEPL